MKKIVCFIVICLLSITLFGCDENMTTINNTSSTNQVEQVKLTESDRKLMKMSYKDFTFDQQDQFLKLQENYNILPESEQKEIKTDYERLIGEEKQDLDEFNKQKQDKLNQDPSVQAVQTYFQAWHDQNWQKMYDVSQESWKNIGSNSADLLNNQYSIKTLNNFEIQSMINKSSAMNEVKVKINYNLGTESKTKYVNANVINEGGMWGVNPISTLKESDY